MMITLLTRIKIAKPIRISKPIILESCGGSPDVSVSPVVGKTVKKELELHLGVPCDKNASNQDKKGKYHWHVFVQGFLAKNKGKEVKWKPSCDFES